MLGAERIERETVFAYADLQPGQTYGSITDKISRVVLTTHSPYGWMIGFGLGAVLLTVYLISIG